MSHQTGIHANDELKVIFANCKSRREIRCLKLSIDKEKLVCGEMKQMSISSNNLDWKQDWSTYMVESFLPKQNPCYVLFRLKNGDDDPDIAVAPPATSASTINSNNNNSAISDEAAKDQWLFVSWTPDSSPIREKMIYASTKSTVKQEFGGGSIFADYFVSCPEDLSLDAVQKWIERKQHIRDGHIDLNELSLNEQELQQVKLDEAALSATLKDKNRSLPNIEMPIADEAIAALYEFKQGISAYVQLSIDPKNETILLEKNEPANGFDLEKKSISSLTPNNHARYHLVSFNYKYNKKQTKATVFIYSIPSSGCPVKERMLYSSVKNSLLQVIQEESKIGIVVDRRIETDDPAELTEKHLYDELHPVEITTLNQQTFVKPKGPSKQKVPSSRRRVL